MHAEVLGANLAVKPGATIMIPKGAIVILVRGLVEGERMVDVRWNGKTITLFAQDLRERGQIVGKTARA
jgi:hypothetical protein